MKLLKFLILALILLVSYLSFWPVPVEPHIWRPAKFQGYVGEYAKNERLETFTKLTMGDLSGPEAAIVDLNGDIVAATHEGFLVRFKLGAEVATPWVDVGGRPLGLDLDREGNIWVANAYKGLQKVLPDGTFKTLLDRVDGTAIAYADDVAVAANGKVYFSDATMRFPAEQWGGTFPASILDIVEHGRTGRIIEYDPISEQARVVMTDLSFANGVAASASGEFLLINETGEYRVWKLWITGDKAGQSEVLLDNLPGFPDNVSLGRDDVFWVGLMAPRSAQIDEYADKPFWRKLLIRLPTVMQPKAKAYGMVIGIDGDGKVLHNLQAPSGKLFTTTGLVETETDVYITSLTAPFLAKVRKADAGLP